MARIFDGRLHVHYGQAYVESPFVEWDFDECFRGQTNGICGAVIPGILFLTTGLHTGRVGFALDLLDAPPPIDQSWEEIVEVSFVPQADETILRDWNGDCVCTIPLSPVPYRVRYCACNMERGREVDTIVGDEPVVDSYALTFWRADPAADAVVKQTSEIADYWHNWVKTLKPLT